MNQTIPQLQYYSKKLCDDVPIRDIIAHYRPDITIREKGNICCPVHKDKTPSAKINEKRNTIKCFGCGFCGDSIDLVSALYNLPFREACDKIMQDFGLDKHNYTNLREIEKIKGSTKGYIDYFPLSQEDISAIGLYDREKIEKTYDVDAQKYYEWYYGKDIPANAEIYNDDGSRKKISLSHAEAVDIGLIEPEKVRENGLPVDKVYYDNTLSLQDLWLDDKYGTERMILGKAYEFIDNISFKEAKCKECLSSWNKSTPVYKKNAERFFMAYINNDKLNEYQLNMAIEYARAVEYKDSISTCRYMRARALQTIDKLKQHQRERAKAERKGNIHR